MDPEQVYVKLCRVYVDLASEGNKIGDKERLVFRAVELANIRWRVHLGDWSLEEKQRRDIQTLCSICKDETATQYVRDEHKKIIFGLCASCRHLEPISVLDLI